MQEYSMQSFKSFLLTEKFEPRPIVYGSNFIDGKFKKFGDSQVTFFQVEEISYCFAVDFDTGNMGFIGSKSPSLNPTDYSFKTVDTFVALKIFNHVLFLVSEYVKIYKPDVLVFSGFSKKLGKIYTTAAKTQSMIDFVEGMRYSIEIHSETVVLKKN